MTLLILFAVVSIATTLFDLVLRARQSAYVARHRDAVPRAFADTVSLADHQRAADYERARLRLGAAASVFSLAIALAWAFFGYDALYAWVADLLPRGLTRSVLFLIAVGAVSWALWPALRHPAHLRHRAALRLQPHPTRRLHRRQAERRRPIPRPQPPAALRPASG